MTDISVELFELFVVYVERLYTACCSSIYYNVLRIITLHIHRNCNKNAALRQGRFKDVSDCCSSAYIVPVYNKPDSRLQVYSIDT
jgi:hypothetical protein